MILFQNFFINRILTTVTILDYRFQITIPNNSIIVSRSCLLKLLLTTFVRVWLEWVLEYGC